MIAIGDVLHGDPDLRKFYSKAKQKFDIPNKKKKELDYNMVINLLITHNVDFFALYDGKGEDKHDLMDKYAEIAEDFTEQFFDARNMEEAIKSWDDVEEKEELIEAIFETEEFLNLYKEHEYDD